MSEHRDAEPAAAVLAERRIGARRRYEAPRLIKESIEAQTASGIHPTNLETDPPFNATS